MLMLGSATTAELAAALRAALKLAGAAALEGIALDPSAKAASALGAAGTFSAGGGRLDENAAGSGGAIEPCGGVESNRSLSTSCATGGFTSKSRSVVEALRAGGRGAAGGVAGRLRSSAAIGASSSTGSISSVRSSPP
jgi:hypothetical protein